MPKRAYPLSKACGLLEPDPVVLVTIMGKDRPDIMTMSWHMIAPCIISDAAHSWRAERRSASP